MIRYQHIHALLFVNNLIKENVNVISSDLSFKEELPRFRTVPLKPLTDQWSRMSKISLLIYWNAFIVEHFVCNLSYIKEINSYFPKVAENKYLLSNVWKTLLTLKRRYLYRTKHIGICKIYKRFSSSLHTKIFVLDKHIIAV